MDCYFHLSTFLNCTFEHVYRCGLNLQGLSQDLSFGQAIFPENLLFGQAEISMKNFQF